jgi:MOSC domain-containing protein YiiM
VAVNVSDRKGVPKTPVSEAELRPDHGLVGDAHAAPGKRQVSLLAVESIERWLSATASASALPKALVGPGAFAENLTVEGLALAGLPVGTQLRIGSAVLLEISQIGKACHTGCAIREAVGDCVMPREGVFARVLVGGLVRPNDRVEVL